MWVCKYNIYDVEFLSTSKKAAKYDEQILSTSENAAPKYSNRVFLARKKYRKTLAVYGSRAKCTAKLR